TFRAGSGGVRRPSGRAARSPKRALRALSLALGPILQPAILTAFAAMLFERAPIIFLVAPVGAAILLPQEVGRAAHGIQEGFVLVVGLHGVHRNSPLERAPRPPVAFMQQCTIRR